MNISSTIKLNNGVEMPLLGLGVWQAKDGDETVDAVKAALKTGYNHIDTAAIYGNERSVGKAIKAMGVPRKDIFVTTKIWNDDHGDPEAAFNTSLEKLGLEYVDLYLIHWPVKERKETWQVMEKLYKEGKARAIGVSNFTIEHLTDFLKDCEIKPAVNQVEFTPYLNQKELLAFCRENDIQLEAYSPLVRGQKLDDPPLVALAERHGKTPAQILIRWYLQQNIVVIPKSSNAKRIQENANVFDFELTDEDMKNLGSLNENLRLCWDPATAPL